MNTHETAVAATTLSAKTAADLKPVTATGSGDSRTPSTVRLEANLAKVNDLFAGQDSTVEEQRSWVEDVVTVLMDDDTTQTQATNNPKIQFMESPDLNDAVGEAVLGNQTSRKKMADIFFTDGKVKSALVHLLGELVHENLKAEEQPA